MQEPSENAHILAGTALVDSTTRIETKIGVQAGLVFFPFY
jgi:hypothetical protein